LGGSNAFALGALKTAAISDTASQQLLTVADGLEQQAAASAPGSAPSMTRFFPPSFCPQRRERHARHLIRKAVDDWHIAAFTTNTQIGLIKDNSSHYAFSGTRPTGCCDCSSVSLLVSSILKKSSKTGQSVLLVAVSSFFNLQIHLLSL